MTTSSCLSGELQWLQTQPSTITHGYDHAIAQPPAPTPPWPPIRTVHIDKRSRSVDVAMDVGWFKLRRDKWPQHKLIPPLQPPLPPPPPPPPPVPSSQVPSSTTSLRSSSSLASSDNTSHTRSPLELKRPPSSAAAAPPDSVNSSDDAYAAALNEQIAIINAAINSKDIAQRQQIMTQAQRKFEMIQRTLAAQPVTANMQPPPPQLTQVQPPPLPPRSQTGFPPPPPQRRSLIPDDDLDQYMAVDEPPSLDDHQTSMNMNVSASAAVMSAVATSSSTTAASAITEWSSHAFPWNSFIAETNRDLFGHSTFRLHQREIINASLSGRDTFVLMPTGGGKTLCYVLAALAGKGLTVVFSPLISLIQDQVAALLASDIPAAKLDSSLGEVQSRAVWNDIMSGLVKILYVCPERLTQSQSFNHLLTSLHRQQRLRAFVIDEAHCVSQWGHDFRPDYMELRRLKSTFPEIPITALTATASDKVRVNICSTLQLKNPILFKQSFNRANLYYEVRLKGKNVRAKGAAEMSDDDDAKSKSVMGKCIDDMIHFIRTQHARHCGIIYGSTIKECEMIYEGLHKAGLSVAVYHAKLSNEQRTAAQMNWSNDEVRIVIATVAFGMGINKPDVRFVIHATMPKSVECLYQEAGRAGRDGAAADTIIYYSYGDKSRLEWLIGNQNNQPPKDPAMIQANREKLRAMVAYCENNVTCRRVQTLAYLGETFVAANCHDNCDNCRAKADVINEDVTEVAQHLVRIVKEMLQRRAEIKPQLVIDIFRGSKSKAVLANRFDDFSSYGFGRHYRNATDVTRLMHECIRLSVFNEYEQVVNAAYNQTSARLSLGPRAAECLSGSMRIQLPFKAKSRAVSRAPSIPSSPTDISFAERRAMPMTSGSEADSWKKNKKKKKPANNKSRAVSIQFNLNVNESSQAPTQRRSRRAAQVVMVDDDDEQKTDDEHDSIQVTPPTYQSQSTATSSFSARRPDTSLDAYRYSAQRNDSALQASNDMTDPDDADRDDDDDVDDCILDSEQREELTGELELARNELARINDVRAFNILTHESLVCFARFLPLDIDSFASMPGLSKAKANKFGDAFLSVIHNYVRRRLIPLSPEKRLEMERGRTQIGTPSPTRLLDQYRRTPGGPQQQPTNVQTQQQTAVTSEYFQPPNSYHFSAPTSMSLQSMPIQAPYNHNHVSSSASQLPSSTNPSRTIVSKRQRIEADAIDDDDECVLVGSKRIGKRQTILGPSTIVTGQQNGTPIVRQRLTYHA